MRRQDQKTLKKILTFIRNNIGMATNEGEFEQNGLGTDEDDDVGVHAAAAAEDAHDLNYARKDGTVRAGRIAVGTAQLRDDDDPSGRKARERSTEVDLLLGASQRLADLDARIARLTNRIDTIGDTIEALERGETLPDNEETRRLKEAYQRRTGKDFDENDPAARDMLLHMAQERRDDLLLEREEHVNERDALMERYPELADGSGEVGDNLGRLDRDAALTAVVAGTAFSDAKAEAYAALGADDDEAARDIARTRDVAESVDAEIVDEFDTEEMAFDAGAGFEAPDVVTAPTGGLSAAQKADPVEPEGQRLNARFAAAGQGGTPEADSAPANAPVPGASA